MSGSQGVQEYDDEALYAAGAQVKVTSPDGASYNVWEAQQPTKGNKPKWPPLGFWTFINTISIAMNG